ncbi:hypothetical protein OYE22_15055 [Streptomyces sp. 71268]|uniref:hypothetical protein n=1 Tax=Streptomyces sp. 71268 TaxID=3002640 RepID=UPI0023F77B5C|nr:hypothetical protein [Streptomyces sp. 71268]WEV26367.1 hypothetical protein OYE22_15055 [Streptomyces sp. 71268]
MGDTPDRIDPSGIPTFTGNLPELEKHIAGLRGDASKVRKTGADTHTEFQKLSSFYKAPEADQLFATTQPVRDTADRFADDLTAVASALEGYATEVRPIKEKLDRLRAEAVAFVEDIEDDDDWRYDGDKVDKNNDLVKDVSATVAQFWAAERAAANKITSLVNGGTVWREDDGSGGKNMYGYSVEDMKKAGETPWGKAVEEKHHAWEIGHWAKSFVWDGFIVEGLWGTLKGLGGLVGLQGWETFKQSWKGLGQLATGLAILTVPGGLIAYDLLPEGGVKNWARDSLKTTKEVGKSMVAWDEWRKNPGKAAGLVGYNVLTTVGTGGAGAATKTGTAGKIAATAGKVGRAVDPMTYIVKAGAAGLGKMPKIGDVTASLTGLTTVKGVELPDGSIRLPDGQVFDPVSPNRPELPPGKSGVELPNGVPRLDVPEGAIFTPEGEYLCRDGTLLNGDGTVKQSRDQIQHELSANDRAALDGTGPGAGSRTGDGAPLGRSPDEATGVRVPERDLVVVGARGGDDVARVGDDASRVGSDVGRVGDDASRVGGDAGRVGDDVSRGGTGPGVGAVGDRPPMGPVAHTGGDGPGGGGSGPGNGPGSGPGDGPGSGSDRGPGSGPGDGPGVRPGDGPGSRPDAGPGPRPDAGPGGGPGREVPGAPAGAGREVPGGGSGELPGTGGAGRDLPESGGGRGPEAGAGEPVGRVGDEAESGVPGGVADEGEQLANNPPPEMTPAERAEHDAKLQELERRNTADFDQFKLDPDNKGRVKDSAMDEARVALDLRERGVLPADIRRPSEADKGDFYSPSQDQYYDLKGVHSDWPPFNNQRDKSLPFRGAYNPANNQRWADKIQDQLNLGRIVVLDVRNANQAAINDIKSLVERHGWSDRIVWYP